MHGPIAEPSYARPPLPATVSLAHAILGMLRAQPMTGYDLKTKCFDRSIAHFWPADQAQIYRTLDRLREDGWVEFEVEAQDDRPNRKVHRLTEAGREELERWLRESHLPLAPVREPFLVQLFFAGLLPDADAREALLHQRRLHEERLARYEAVPLPPLGTKGLGREHAFQRMTLDLGLAHERATLDWIDRCLAHLDDRKPKRRAPA